MDSTPKIGSNYFGEQRKDNDRITYTSRASQICMFVSSSIGLISVLALIALNVTNLITTIKSQNSDSDLKPLLSDTYIVSQDIKTKISSSLDPKLNLVNTATSFTLPNMINSQIKQLRNDLYKVCTPRYESNTQTCPVQQNPSHSSLFHEFDPNLWVNCTGGVVYHTSTAAFNFSITKSITTQPTSPTGCVRIPTLHVGSTLFSYSDNIIQYGCSDASTSAQNWVIGIINRGPDFSPEFDILENWLLWDDINRKSCSTVTSTDNAWMICTVATKPETEDYLTQGIENLWIGYMDVYGTRRYWIFPQADISLDQDYSAMYPSVGSGIIKDGKVYFLMYGGLFTDIEMDPYCILTDCAPATLNTCKNAQHPKRFGEKRVVNMILSFDDTVGKKPNIVVKLIPPSLYSIGAEGRLYYFSTDEKTYIYLRSSACPSFLQFGEIDFSNNYTINWFPYSTFTRPGPQPCNAGNKCPGAMLTGVYTDFFPLSIKDHLGISVMLSGGSLRRGPVIRLADSTNVYVSKYITTQNQEASYTTTTCFMFKMRPWCVSVVEMKPGVMGAYEPVFLVYPIWNNCEIESLQYSPDYDYSSEE